MKFYHEIKDNDDPLRHNVDMHITHKFKYRIMWELRGLEEDITKEGGQLIFTEDDEVWTNGFSPELDARIWVAIHAIDFAKW